MVMLDAIIRLIPGVLGDETSVLRKVFLPLAGIPQYTRPAVYEGRWYQKYCSPDIMKIYAVIVKNKAY